jgi:hypothetical protein
VGCRAEEDEWAELIRGKAAQGAISEVAFMQALQRKMEATVLTLKSGSYAQVVQVMPTSRHTEYLLGLSSAQAAMALPHPRIC